MKEITDFDPDLSKEVHSISQDDQQYDKYSVALYTSDSGTYVVREDFCSHSEDYILEKGEVDLLKDIGEVAFLDAWATEWAVNEEDTPVEMCRWGFADINDYEASNHDDGPFGILYKRFFFGYIPKGRVTDAYGEQLTFDNYQDAEAWCKKVNAATYVLSHGEYRRPVYIITEAL